MNAHEALNALRASAQSLPLGKRNQVLNRCDRISLILRKYSDAPLPSEESEAIKDRSNTNKRILAAMIAGREVSYLDRQEFRTTEWHTRICEVKEMVEKATPQRYVFCSRWASDGKHPYKIYWLEEK